MAKKPASGVALTDEVRANCLACAQGKQTKNKQSRKDTSGNSSIDVIGGGICSDLKGPTKDVAALKFKHFMVFFERQFNCRIHVLRTDGGGEYKTLDLFCKNTGIARQVSEQRNQASNGKAKRMHRTIMNMVPYQNEPGVEVAATDADEEHTRSERHRGVWVAVHGTRGRRNKSLGERGKPDMIVGKSDEIKGYRVYIPRDKVLVVMQYVSNVETLSDVQNEQLKRVHLDDSEESGGGDSSEKKTSGKPKRKSKRHGKKTGWTRDKHQTRAATRKTAEANASQGASGE
ncbi:hypothetical protein PC111_g8459 [Phytophthora cactorum]|nr:hypothetical protein PC111_g8459 [Phytophthora cactorum]